MQHFVERTRARSRISYAMFSGLVTAMCDSGHRSSASILVSGIGCTAHSGGEWRSCAQRAHEAKVLVGQYPIPSWALMAKLRTESKLSKRPRKALPNTHQGESALTAAEKAFLLRIKLVKTDYAFVFLAPLSFENKLESDFRCQ